MEVKEIIEEITDYYFEVLTDKLIFKIKRADKGIRLAPDSSLNNVWEEICVQVQSDTWDGWTFLEQHLYSLCSIEIEKLPVSIQDALSSEFFEDNNGKLEMVDIDSSQKLLDLILKRATNFTNNRIDNYLYNLS